MDREESFWVDSGSKSQGKTVNRGMECSLTLKKVIMSVAQVKVGPDERRGESEWSRRQMRADCVHTRIGARLRDRVCAWIDARRGVRFPTSPSSMQEQSKGGSNAQSLSRPRDSLFSLNTLTHPPATSTLRTSLSPS